MTYFLNNRLGQTEKYISIEVSIEFKIIICIKVIIEQITKHIRYLIF